MKKTVLFLAVALAFGQAFAQKNSAWKKVGLDAAKNSATIKGGVYSENQQFYSFNADALRQSLTGVADRLNGGAGVEITMPTMDGGSERFMVWEASNMSSSVQAQFPEIRSYIGTGITDKTASINFSLSPQGIQTMVLRADHGTEFIEPYTTNRSVYIMFDSKTRVRGSLPFNCTTEDVQINQDLLPTAAELGRSNNQVLKTFRLAMSCTGEYAQFHGGTVAGALAAINATMTRVNGVFEKDFAVRMNLIDNESAIIFLNAGTDPYTAAPAIGDWNAQLQSTLTSVIGAANYDVGHLFGASGGGGNAGCIGCVCGASKGSGITSPADGIPMGDNFDIDYVAHELGHQFGGNHTFSFSSENNAVNVEPGSGSTIMGYAGITGGTDVQPHSDDYFAYRSILQVQTNLLNKTCQVNTPLTNDPPTIDAGIDRVIPKGTAFVLTGTGSDPNGDTVLYNWEENDDATTVGAGASYPSFTKTNGPNFRSLPSKSTPVRYMPELATVFNGQLASTWESVSNVGRAMKFTLTGRDNVAGQSQTQTDEILVTVDATKGPFVVTSPNTAGASFPTGSAQTVTWQSNGAETIEGSGTVDIFYSGDGGATLVTLATNVPNTGSASVTLPNTPAIYARIMVKPTGAIYYAVNSIPFAVGYIVTNTCNTYTNTDVLVVPDGAGANVPGPTVTSTITVPDVLNITDVNVTVNANHTFMWDLQVKLKHPDNTSNILLYRNCNQASGAYNVTLNDNSGTIPCGPSGSPVTATFSPIEPLAVYNDKQSNGVWTLSAFDTYAGDTGQINSWSMEICSQTITLMKKSFGFDDFAVFPNPNNGNFNIKFSNASDSGVKVMVADLRGRVILQKDYAGQATFNQNIQLNNAQSGVYLLTVTDGSRKEVRKIIVN